MSRTHTSHTTDSTGMGPGVNGSSSLTGMGMDKDRDTSPTHMQGDSTAGTGTGGPHGVAGALRSAVEHLPGMHGHGHSSHASEHTTASGMPLTGDAATGGASTGHTVEGGAHSKGTIAAITEALKEAVTINPPPGPHNARA